MPPWLPVSGEGALRYRRLLVIGYDGLDLWTQGNEIGKGVERGEGWWWGGGVEKEIERRARYIKIEPIPSLCQKFGSWD
jgi:hypothetical protein